MPDSAKPSQEPRAGARPILVRKQDQIKSSANAKPSSQAHDEALGSANLPPQLRELAAEPRKFNDRPISGEARVPEFVPQSSSRGSTRRRRRRRSNPNAWRTIFSCVAAALAAGPIAILILKLVFNIDTLNLWGQVRNEISVRRPVNPANRSAPSPTPAAQRNDNLPTNEPKEPTQGQILTSQPKSPEDETNDGRSEGRYESMLGDGPYGRTGGGTADRTRDQRMPVPTTNELAGPQSELERLFIDDYEKAKNNANPAAQNVALFELGKKLFTNGKLVQTQDGNGAIVKQNCIEKYVMYQVALHIIVESGDDALVEQICESISSKYQVENYELTNKITTVRIDNILAFSTGKVRTVQSISALKLLFQETLTNSRISIAAGNKTAAVAQLELTPRILDQLQPDLYLDPSDRTQLNNLLAEMFDECLSNSGQHIENLHFELADNVLQLATRIATIGRGENEKSIADKLIAQNARFLRLYLAYEDAKPKYKNSPNDPNINSAIGNYTILILNKWDEGLLFLARGRDATLAKIAKTDNLSTAPARERNASVNVTDKMKLAKQWQQLYKPSDLDVDRKAIILGRTRFWYEQTIPDLTSPFQRLEIEKLLDELSKEPK